MLAVKAYYDGRAFVPENPFKAEINQKAVITILDNNASDVLQKEQLLTLAGSLSNEDYREVEEALENTGKVYPSEW